MARRHHQHRLAYIFSVLPTSLSFLATDGSTKIATVQSGKGISFVDFSIESKPSWLTVAKGSNSGLAVVLSVTSTDNSNGVRTGNIVLKQNETGTILNIIVTQAAFTSVFTASPMSFTYESSANLSKTSTVTSSINGIYSDYAITSAPSWLTVTKGSSSGVTSVLTMVASVNSGALRSGSVVLTQNTTGDTITLSVQQNAVAIQFSASRTSLSYTAGVVCADENDTNIITSSVNGVFTGYVITSKPSWTTISIGSTSGLTSTLNISVSANRTENNKTGSIVLTQNGTANVLTIPISQTSQFGADGLPVSYPTVGTENILNTIYDTAYVGDQVWSRTNMDFYMSAQSFNITQLIINTWRTHNGSWFTNTPTAAEYNSVFYKSYNRVGKESFNAELQSWYGDSVIDIHKHQIPEYADFLYLMGFLVSQNGGVNGTQGQSILKYPLNESTDPWDCARDSYPSTWGGDNSGGLKGSDKYLLGFNLGGSYQPYDETLTTVELFRKASYHVRDVVSGADANWDNQVLYNEGWHFPRNFAAGFQNAYYARPIKTVRYLTLGWDIYDNGTEIRKINNGDTIPVGFTVVPRGALRGAWFGNKAASRATLQGYVDQINQWISNDWSYMG